ncbi:hypothetical protein [Psychrobacillus phage Perkons]|nr:hypothetical protein [Psychrobacillus phage Perkons]
MSDLKEVTSLAFTLLIQSGALTEAELNIAKEEGYDGLNVLLAEKILKVTGTLN